MPLKIIDYGTKEYDLMVELRNEILRKPLGMILDETDISADRDNILIGAFEEDKMLGCCMLVRENMNSVLLRQMAVRNQLQGKGIGRALMDFAEAIARDIGCREISMHARSTSAGFYEKMGYRTSGDTFMKLSIPHILMTKRI
ncbi:MAG: GNAT family N-acetyltransferase [Niabella sp.]